MTDDTREQLLRELMRSQQQVSALLRAMSDAQDWQPEPAEWSFRCVAAHLAAIERKCYLRRLAGIASGTNPTLPTYSGTVQDLVREDLNESLLRWQAVRHELVEFVRSLPEETLSFTGVHEAFGAVTVLDTLAEIVEQDHRQARHLQQLIRDYYEELAQVN